jgi:formylglycine-generating enzyme required for sulfatase activity
LIHLAPRQQKWVRLLWEKLADVPQSALFLILGQLTREECVQAVGQDPTALLLKRYGQHEWPGVHSALDWLLHRWGQDDELQKIDRELASWLPLKGRLWYVDEQGHTLVVMEPSPFAEEEGTRAIVFKMGSPASELDRDAAEDQHLRKISRTFAIASKEVTVDQFQDFLRTHPSLGPANFKEQLSRHPVTEVSWYAAAAYCNWLSKKAGLPEDQWCYAPNPEGEYAPGMKLAPDYLKRTGYRLPTEAEWEYACRADKERSRFFGETARFLGTYAWYRNNAKGRTWPAGQTMPNGFGMFDMYGNAWEWCQDPWSSYPAAKIGDRPHEDREDPTAEVGSQLRVMRGGGVDSPASELRSAFRKGQLPSQGGSFAGFRVARTLPTP